MRTGSYVAMKNKEAFHAVLDEDLRHLLTSIGLLESVESGEQVCGHCGEPISLRNLQIILPLEEGAFSLICNSTLCVEEFSSSKSRRT